MERELNDYTALGARWIRHDFAWDAIEPRKGAFDWGGFDRWVGDARSRALNVIATISYTPAWANGGYANHDYGPLSADAYGEFAGAVAARYAAQGVHTYEIWNEPNIHQFWKPVPNPASYVSDLCAAYTQIHRNDKDAVVITGGSSPAGTGAESYSPQDWLEAVYSAGGGSCFDAVAHHPYVDSWWNWEIMSEYSGGTLRKIMEAHGDAVKKVWATEVGCDWKLHGATEAAGRAACAERLTQALAKWRSYSWAAALCWFTYWDPNVYGLVDEHWTPRPAWYAYQAAAALYH